MTMKMIMMMALMLMVMKMMMIALVLMRLKAIHQTRACKRHQRTFPSLLQRVLMHTCHHHASAIYGDW